MILIQLTGLSGAGKTTVSKKTADSLRHLGYRVEIIDGDEYRQTVCKDLGFSKNDRMENIRRLGFIGATLAKHGVIAILSAINPYEEVRRELKAKYPSVKTVWIDCDLPTLIARDTKGLYQRALLPDDDPQKLNNLTGVNDQFDEPLQPDLTIHANEETEDESAAKLLNFVLSELHEKRLNEKPRAMFIGRWQPFHNGHKWLIEQKISQGIPVLIAVRDILPDAQNPLTTWQTIEILEKMYQGEDVKIVSIPNIESVNFGRGVGYAINEFTPPVSVGMISATQIREEIRNGAESWKESVDEKIQDLVMKYLR